MKSILTASLMLLSLKTFAGFGFPIGDIGNVITGIKQIDAMTSTNKPHICRLNTHMVGSFEAKGDTLAAAKYNTLKKCQQESSDSFFCREPSDSDCEKISESAAESQSPSSHPVPSSECVRKGKLCKGDLFQCEWTNGATQRIYVKMAFSTNKGEYIVADYETNGTDKLYDKQVPASDVDFNVCDRVKTKLENSPIQ